MSSDPNKPHSEKDSEAPASPISGGIGALDISNIPKGSFIQQLPGIERYTVVTSDRSQIVLFRFAKGAVLPKHHHSNDQIGTCLSGGGTVYIGGVPHPLTPGVGYIIPPDVEHWAEVTEDSLIIDCFTPPREDYR